MTIHITPEKMIKDVQKEFNEAFPFLKIEFFKKGFRYRHAVPQDEVLRKEIKMGIKTFNTKGGVSITGAMTVRELEKTCEENLGLSVLIYRKSGNLWLETTMT